MARTTFYCIVYKENEYIICTDLVGAKFISFVIKFPLTNKMQSLAKEILFVCTVILLSNSIESKNVFGKIQDQPIRMYSFVFYLS